MEPQINNTETAIQNRLSVVVCQRELKNWKKIFQAYGAKTACSLATGLHVNTIQRVLKEGRGDITTIQRIRGYAGTA